MTTNLELANKLKDLHSAAAHSRPRQAYRVISAKLEVWVHPFFDDPEVPVLDAWYNGVRVFYCHEDGCFDTPMGRNVPEWKGHVHSLHRNLTNKVRRAI
jgi:hypothetical protein